MPTTYERITSVLPESQWYRYTYETPYDGEPIATIVVGAMCFVVMPGGTQTLAEDLKRKLRALRIPFDYKILKDETTPRIRFKNLPERYDIEAINFNKVFLTCRNSVVRYNNIPISVIAEAEKRIAKAAKEMQI